MVGKICEEPGNITTALCFPRSFTPVFADFEVGSTFEDVSTAELMDLSDDLYDHFVITLIRISSCKVKPWLR
jgi:hypothetical protein